MFFGIGCGAYDAGAWRMNSEHEVRHFIMRLSTYMRLVYSKTHDVFLLL